MNSKGFDYTALTIVIIGAINWGLIGFFNFNLVSFLFGQTGWISRIIYAIVGLCGIYLVSAYGRVAMIRPLMGLPISARSPMISNSLWRAGSLSHTKGTWLM